jgi:excinuclease ABC subunit C
MDKDKLSALPEKPGVYIFRDSDGKVIYIGKAKILRNRVRSYFQDSVKDVKTEQLSKNVYDIDYIVAKNELEAFILENSLIKEHKPHYNILLKDDKSYPYLKITMNEKYPGVYITRMIKDKKAKYFGPYFARDAKKVLKIIYSVFKVRQCAYTFDTKPLKRPCIYYDTGECTAPCVRFISDNAYMQSVKEVIRFLNGNYKDTEAILEKQMKDYAEKKEYEKAAEARDAISSIKEIMIEQRMVTSEDKNIDIVDLVYQAGNYYFCVLNVRTGRLLGKKITVFSGIPEETDALSIFLMQYYGRGIILPEEIILPAGQGDEDIIRNYIFNGRDVKVIFKQRDDFLKMAQENIHEKIKELETLEEKKMGVNLENLRQSVDLQESLKLESPPVVIDGIDISHLHGENTVASCVVFKNGSPDKNNYRRYKIHVEGIDDFESIREVVRRRYARIKEESGKMPDLILIDGGMGQVNSAAMILRELGITADVIGLAKREEEVFKPFNAEPVPMKKGGRFLLMRVRDEAHRFAVSYQMSLSNKKMIKSIFDDIPFVGEKTKNEIYKEFRSTGELLKAIQEDSGRVAFLNKKQKDGILEYLKDKKSIDTP